MKRQATLAEIEAEAQCRRDMDAAVAQWIAAHPTRELRDPMEAAAYLRRSAGSLLAKLAEIIEPEEFAMAQAAMAAGIAKAVRERLS